tara:strand:- start:251 stop:1990 length:1740 start_codon:yes stop_codon:yes gene_type:complete
MDAQQFLAEFGHIANAPGGIARLRELILDLAIRGELLAEQTGVSNATSLIREIIEFRLKLVQDGKLRRPTPLPEIEESELSFKLPDSWAFERLGNICEIVRGVTFPSSKKQTFRTDDVVACLRTSNVQAEVDWSDLIFINPDLVKRDDQWIEFGDTMISMANSYELVGKVALVREVKERATFGGFIAAIRPHVIEPEYLYLVLRSPYMQSRMRVTASQTTNIANISLGGMRPIPTPIPPKEEQSRIVAKVDELMALCDQLEAQQQKRRTLQNHLRQATLQAVAASQSPHELQESWQRLEANFGQLFSVAEDVDELDLCIKQLALKGLLTSLDTAEAISDELMQKSESTTAVESPEMDWEIPEHWIWARSAWLGEARLGKMLDASKNKGEPTPYLRNVNVRWNKFDLHDVLQMRVEDHELPRITIQRGDLVICEGGEPGRSAIWDRDEKFVIQKALHRFRCGPDVLPDYLLFCLQHDYFSGRLSRYYTGATIKHLTGKALAEYSVPLPPVGEQRRILLAAKALSSVSSKLRRQLSSLKHNGELLATATISTLTGIAIEQEEEPMKAPQTEVAEMREKASS